MYVIAYWLSDSHQAPNCEINSSIEMSTHKVVDMICGFAPGKKKKNDKKKFNLLFFKRY